MYRRRLKNACYMSREAPSWGTAEERTSPSVTASGHSAMIAILGLDLGEFKGLVRIYDHDTTKARSPRSTPTLPTCVAPGAERPGLVVFETRTFTGRIADSHDESRLHKHVADSMHEAGSCGISSSTSPIGQQDRRRAVRRLPSEAASGTARRRRGHRPHGRRKLHPATPLGVAGATAIGARIGDLPVSVVGGGSWTGWRAGGWAEPEPGGNARWPTIAISWLNATTRRANSRRRWSTASDPPSALCLTRHPNHADNGRICRGMAIGLSPCLASTASAPGGGL